ncbi:hypothetical protein WJX73_005667 [Symbiochloris irregularis]|uniref:Uncharacterized protein n=1 Tax=Symbiochloris irregularis TaxID=706552 RepID=A0AAW1P434_9CHLO
MPVEFDSADWARGSELGWVLFSYGLEVKPVAQMSTLRVLDIRHRGSVYDGESCNLQIHGKRPAILEQELEHLGNLSLVAMSSGMLPSNFSEKFSRWKRCEVDLSAYQGASRALSQFTGKRKRLQEQHKRSILLENNTLIGRDVKQDAVDKERMCLFDSFWWSHLRLGGSSHLWDDGDDDDDSADGDQIYGCGYSRAEYDRVYGDPYASYYEPADYMDPQFDSAPQLSSFLQTVTDKEMYLPDTP